MNPFAFGKASTCSVYDAFGDQRGLKSQICCSTICFTKRTMIVINKVMKHTRNVVILGKMWSHALEFSKCPPLPWKISKRNPKPYTIFPGLTTLIRNGIGICSCVFTIKLL